MDSSEELFNGDFLLGISHFGAVAASTPEVQQDLEFFKSRGINNVRGWANWTLGGVPNGPCSS